MLVLSSPSGAGKTTIVNEIMKIDPNLKSSVSVTTRPKRANEIDGLHYYFIAEDEFWFRFHKGEFLEHAEVFGYMYATPKNFVMDTLQTGHDVIFDIDWQGTQQLSECSRDDLVTVFILPPSLSELEVRLRGRNQDSENVIMKRMNEASSEMSHWAEYNYVFVNNELEDSVDIVRSILTAERHRRKRQFGIAEFVNDMRHVK